jgi:DNA ligase-1
MIATHEELDEFLKTVCNQGYEGLMLKQLDWKWKRTSSRTVDLCKYKKRRTADLLCTDATEGEGKYVGKIGALVLQDSIGRIVSVGSGLSDTDRAKSPTTYIGKVIEIEYEQIIDTYIQPTFIQVRDDKDDLHID